MKSKFSEPKFIYNMVPGSPEECACSHCVTYMSNAYKFDNVFIPLYRTYLGNFCIGRIKELEKTNPTFALGLGHDA